jgi:small subunit ribosomal protein S8
MSQDIVADALNQIMNAKRARKKEVIIKKHSKLLRNILDIAKESGYLDYSIKDKDMKIEIKELNEIKAIKPRYTVSVKKMNHYVRRFLPSRDFGFIIVSTNQGLMKHYDAEKENLGGCLIAYLF